MYLIATVTFSLYEIFVVNMCMTLILIFRMEQKERSRNKKWTCAVHVEIFVFILAILFQSLAAQQEKAPNTHTQAGRDSKRQ